MTSKTIQTTILGDTTTAVPPRTIGYCIANGNVNTSVTTTAILYFYPLGGCSDFVKYLNVSKICAKLICVDRPGCGETSWEDDKDDDKKEESSAELHRIHTHADDVLAVLKHERIQHVYILSVCIGQPYAMEVGRRILKGETTAFEPTCLKGITLVAPFVSTACPNAWGVARLGSHVPHFMLHGVSSLKNGFFPLSIKYMGPNMMNKIISQQEQEDFGWTQQDFQKGAEMALEMNTKSQHCQTMEVRVGVSDQWQTICDEFASLDDEIPIVIHVSPEDKLVSKESIEWVRERCYPNSTLKVHDDMHSHEIMTMMGGPPHNPVLLNEIAQDWNLYHKES